jgi:hypothetical protein
VDARLRWNVQDLSTLVLSHTVAFSPPSPSAARLAPGSRLSLNTLLAPFAAFVLQSKVSSGLAILATGVLPIVDHFIVSPPPLCPPLLFLLPLQAVQ